MSERERRLGETVLTLTETLRYRLKNPENFEAAKKQLEEGSLIIYLNHFHKLDVPVYGHILMEKIAPLENITIMAAMKQIDPSRGFVAKLQHSSANGLSETRGLTTIPVVQDKEKELYENANEFNRRALRQSLESLRSRGNILILAPEGTRSKNGQLQEANEGMELLFRLSRKNALAMPIVLQPFPLLPRQVSIIPFATNIEAIAGKPFSYDEILQEQNDNPGTDVTTLMMRHMAQLLRPQNRGVYKV